MNRASVADLTRPAASNSPSTTPDVLGGLRFVGRLPDANVITSTKESGRISDGRRIDRRISPLRTRRAHGVGHRGGAGHRANPRGLPSPTPVPTSLSACVIQRAPATSNRRSRRWAGAAFGSPWTSSTFRQIAAAVDRVVAEFGHLDILVNNAGLGPANKAEDVTESDYDLTFDVNVKGTFFASQAAGRAMIRQRVRTDHQPQLTGRLRRLTDRVGVLRHEGGDRPPDQVSRRRMGQPRHHRQRRRPDVHPHPRHRARPRRPRVPRRGRRADRRPAPRRRTGRRRRRRRVPRFAGRRPDHRHDLADRRWLDRP